MKNDSWVFGLRCSWDDGAMTNMRKTREEQVSGRGKLKAQL